MPVIVPFFQEHGLDMGEIYQLQAIFALGLVLFEVPSGYVADLLGRKRCLVAASVLIGVAFGVLALGQSYAAFVVFEVVATLANSLFSGTDVALLYDTIEAVPEERRLPSTVLLGRRLFWAQTGETVAALLGGALVLIHITAPAWVNAVTAWVPLVLSLTLVEPPRAKLDPRSHRANIELALRLFFAQSRLLRLVLFNLVVYGLATLLAVWAFQGLWKHLGISVGWFGVLWASYNLTVAATAHQAHRIERALGLPGTLVLIATLPVVGYAGLGLFGWLGMGGGGLFVAAAVASGLAFQVGRGLTQVVLRDTLNRRVPTELRATANSVSSLGVRLAFAVVGPFLGTRIDHDGYLQAFLAAAGLFIVLGALVALPLLGEFRKIWR